MIAAFFLPPIEYLFLPSVLPRQNWMEIVGLILILLGSALFVWARRTLGKFYSGHASIVEDQPLVQSGPYRFIRHPAYMGYLLMASGIACGYSSLAGFIATLFLLSPATIYRASVEDKLLSEQFGEMWMEYRQRVPSFIPRLRRGG